MGWTAPTLAAGAPPTWCCSTWSGRPPSTPLAFREQGQVLAVGRPGAAGLAVVTIVAGRVAFDRDAAA
jgi:hypothetical protein